jgi:hypothetical protein
MLAAEAPFPMTGSWALYEDGGTTRAVRIITRHPRDSMVTIAIDGVRTASGNKRVPLAELRDPTPLTLHEEGEMDRLERAIARTKSPKRSDVSRATALRTRMIDAMTLSNLRAVTATRRTA